MRTAISVIIGIAAALAWSTAGAQERPVLDSGAPLAEAQISQDGREARALEAMLKGIELPDGFGIELFAMAPGARHFALSPSKRIVFVGTRGGDVWAISLNPEGNTAERVAAFAPFVDFTMPHGVCFAPDGTLYIAEQNRVLAFPQAEETFSADAITAEVVVPQGRLIPPNEESSSHSTRVCDIGPDGRFYVTLGQPYNVTPADKVALYEELGIGGILAMQANGSDREVYSVGIRNSAGMEFRPASGDLWWTDNQVDGMGNDIPPEEINRQTAAGQHFGFPWYGGGTIRTRPFRDSQPPEGLIFPVVETDAHAASLGMTFYTAEQFPERYKGGIFVAQRGSWNRTPRIGARVIFVPLDAQGNPGAVEIFAQGWLDPRTSEYHGRLADVALLPDGSLLVSDDRSGAVYRIFYEG
ncbi:MAG: PQQ-dependent sugar dehydrogenase [Kiloniellales bacterium]